MNHVRLANLVLAGAAAAVFAAVCLAQTGEFPAPAPYPARSVPPDATIPYRTRPAPRVRFLPESASDGSSADASRFITYRSGSAIRAADRRLAARSMPAIRSAAAQAGMDFGRAQWSYRQLDCQAFPGHLFLLFENDRGPGDLSLFAASIPRSANGRLRILPVERRGDSLFTPAPGNAMAIHAFNRIRAEEPASQHEDWLAASLCYAALTEPGSTIALSPAHAPDANLALSFPPSIELGAQQESTVRFVNMASGRQPMLWMLTFAAQNSLVNVEITPTPVYATRIVPGK